MKRDDIILLVNFCALLPFYVIVQEGIPFYIDILLIVILLIMAIDLAYKAIKIFKELLKNKKIQ